MNAKLKDVVKSANTGADAIQRAPIVEYDTGIKCLRIGDISNNRAYSDWGFAKVSVENYKRYKLQKGSILVARTGSTVGINKYIDEEYNSVYNNGLIRLEVDERYNSKFIYYIMQTNKFKNYINGIAFGTTGQPNIQIDDLLNFEFKLFPIDIQNRIVKILYDIDKKIELNNQLNEKLSKIINSVYKETFRNLSNFDKAENVANITIGKTPPRSFSECFSKNENDINWVSISDLGKNGIYIGNTTERLTVEAVKRYNVKIIPKETVILSFKLTVGRVAITRGEMATNEAIAHFNLNNEKMKYFIYCYLKNFDFESLGSTSSIAIAVNSKIIKGMPIALPEEENLEKFNNVVAPLFDMVKNNEIENENLSNLRDTLLSKLMNGEVDLDRIKV